MSTLKKSATDKKIVLSDPENSVVIAEEFRHMKRMSQCALRKMIQQFETSKKLRILLCRGRKKSPSSSFENVATSDVEANSHSLHSSVSVSDFFCALDMPYFTAQNVLRNILHFYP